MNYPVWEIGIGGGLLIAVVSILHVFVSHFAVGGGLWLVVSEMRANRRSDQELRTFVKSHSRFFMLLTLVFGAISGVGIWVTIALVSPHGVSALTHGYVWGWAMEWVFFIVEIGAALVYYYGWERLDARTHVAVGWIYCVAAIISMVIINGIITFMLTPGDWLENKEFWTGFFNPTYWPSLVVRLCVAIAIAGMFTLLSAAVLPSGAFRRRVTRWNAAWASLPLILVALGLIWYGRAIVPWRDNEALLGAIPILPALVRYLQAGLVVTFLVALWPLIAPRTWSRPAAAVLLLAGLLTMGAGEWLREAGRKPFTIHGYLYSTGLLVDRQEEVTAAGMAASTKWLSGAARTDRTALGRELFLAWCQPCHTRDGYNGLRPFLAHWNEETVASLVPRLQNMRALMPPWPGTEEENAALTAHLLALKGNLAADLPADPAAAREASFSVSCGLCHTVGGFRSLDESFTGMSPEEIEEFLDMAGDLTEEMPGYYLTGKHREALVEFLHELGSAGAGEEGSAS